MNNDLFINQNEITKDEFDLMVKFKNLEVISGEHFANYVDSLSSLFEKSDFDELNDLEKSSMDLFKSNVDSLNKWVVNEWSDDHGRVIKSIAYTREKQIEWDRDDNDNILKGQRGTYLDTELNRKLDRVGNKYNASNKDSE